MFFGFSEIVARAELASFVKSVKIGPNEQNAAEGLNDFVNTTHVKSISE